VKVCDRSKKNLPQEVGASTLNVWYLLHMPTRYDTQQPKSCMVIKSDERKKIFTLDPPTAPDKIFLTSMLTRDLLAIANFLYLYFTVPPDL